ncbi:hypothetical protein GOP47_0015210 [Adiantum capillus-veneris]|uniref:BSD2 cysteine rich domain-containing protein n=1 Tax=Adiantum capillus-veneris TaxID=13818 RepID=A0A9D4ZE86_ADICA|nr:hypothetical protein GOP47_0015210 [Adiantum capillus-veneris]
MEGAACCHLSGSSFIWTRHGRTKPSSSVLFSADKATSRSVQGSMCMCSTTHHSYFGRSSAVEPLRAVEVRATEPDTQEPPPACSVNSILCKQCQGNGAIVCSQCKGDGINKEDFFSGHFKAGSICWLCRGKREMLCGDCNGAGFIGGFMSTFDD